MQSSRIKLYHPVLSIFNITYKLKIIRIQSINCKFVNVKFVRYFFCFEGIELENHLDDLQLRVAQFLVNIRETYRISSIALDAVTEGLFDFLTFFLTTILVSYFYN